MPRRLIIVSTLVVAAALPAAALGQAWPAGVVAAAPRTLPMAAKPFVVLRDEDVGVRRQAKLPPTDPRTPRRLMLTPADAEDIPDVEIRPRAEWTDDEGLRLSPTRVAYKRRF